jgi:hypothetical protein
MDRRFNAFGTEVVGNAAGNSGPGPAGCTEHGEALEAMIVRVTSP